MSDPNQTDEPRNPHLTYHVVCHDCRFELTINADGRLAESIGDRHELDHDHNVDCERVDQ